MFALTPHPITGNPYRWSRDMAFIGLTTSAVTPAILFLYTPPFYAVFAAVIGGITGGILGLTMPTMLNRVRGRVSLWLLVPGSVLLGGLWGGLTGSLAGLPFGWTAAGLGWIAGGIAGAAQFGWLWFPYTFQTVRQKQTWPLLLLATLGLPIVAALSFMGTLLLVV